MVELPREGKQTKKYVRSRIGNVFYLGLFCFTSNLKTHGYWENQGSANAREWQSIISDLLGDL